MPTLRRALDGARQSTAPVSTRNSAANPLPRPASLRTVVVTCVKPIGRYHKTAGSRQQCAGLAAFAFPQMAGRRSGGWLRASQRHPKEKRFTGGGRLSSVNDQVVKVFFD